MARRSAASQQTQRLFSLSAGFLRERLPVVVSHNKAAPLVLRPTGRREAAAGIAGQDRVAAAAKAVGQQVHIIGASSEDEIQRAFETFADEKVVALLVATGAFFGTRTQSIVALAARYALPAVYDRREFAAAGGLISYGTRFADVFRQGGIYIARILKGAKPADLPVLEPTKFELVLNIKTAKALGLKVPWQLQQLADEVIE